MVQKTQTNPSGLQAELSSAQRIAVIPGDGIGVEVAQVGVQVLEAVAERFGFQLTELHQAPLGSPLLPLLMWYDKPHIVWTDYLRTRVYACGILRPGDFVEDVFGRAQMEDIKKHGMDAHSRYGTWVLCDDDTSPVTYHLSGRKVLAQQATATATPRVGAG